MISPIGSLALTGVVVTTGRWSKGQSLAARPVIGLAFAAVVLAMLSEADAEFAAQFAFLILVGTLFVYGPAIVKKVGLTK
jgi:uncharacterized protein involved in response to NO